MNAYRHIFLAIIGMGITILIGTAGFKILENLAFFDALWMTVITVLTVGYGDRIPQTLNGKTFALVIIPVASAWSPMPWAQYRRPSLKETFRKQ